MTSVLRMTGFVVSAVALSMLSGCGSSSVPAGDGVDPTTSADVTPPNAPSQSGVSDATPAPATTTEKENAPPASSPSSLGPIGEWTWIDVPGAVCGYGQPTGFAVNVGTGSDVLFFLEGGGLCWDELSCSVINDEGTVGLPHHFNTGYDAETFRTQSEIGGGVFDRARANNPFKDSTVVYIPYCTGDFHAGSTAPTFAVGKRTAHFAGRQNLDLFLAKVVPALSNASRVTLAGSSAGGYGAIINFWHVKEAFGNKRVDLISDSSPLLWNNAAIFSGLSAWNANAALPPGCPECVGNLRALYSYYARTYPDSRIAVTTNDQDLASSIGAYTLTPFPQFYDAIRDLTVDTLKPLSNLKYFVADGTHHPLMSEIDTVSQPHCCRKWLGLCESVACGSAMSLADWLTKMVRDDPTWTNQTAIIE